MQDVGALQKKLKAARVLSANHEHAQAAQVYDKLTQQFPNISLVWFEYGCAAGGAGQMEAAARAWERAISMESDRGELIQKIGRQYQKLRQPALAGAWFEKAIAANPKDIPSRLALAGMLEQSNRLAEARAAIDLCLSMEPRDEQARYLSAFLDRREYKLERAERQLRDLISSNPRQPKIQYGSRYELAEILDRTERYGEAMQVLTDAKNIVRRMGNMDAMLREYDESAGFYIRTTRELPRDILHTWAREFPAKARGKIQPLAFLGGHPRSGTTLLEKILGATRTLPHWTNPRAFSTVVSPMFNTSPQISAPRLNIIRGRYLEALQSEWGSDFAGKFILDKNPSPTLKLRIWLRVFPELRVLMALRDPRDVVISCYFQNLPLNPFNANFLSLERTARHYANLMDIWLAARQWEGFAWTETHYEKLVANVETEGRRVTEFLRLTWNEGQRQFYQKRGEQTMHSPTYHDASLPVYDRSLARWRHYAQHLAPSLSILEPYCRAFGYS